MLSGLANPRRMKNERVHYANFFHGLLAQVSEDAGWVLQLVHDTRGLALDELEAALNHGNIKDLNSCLNELVDLGLVVQQQDQWKTTWSGAGVSNWRTQLHCADEKPVTEPSAGENGTHLGPECTEYRPALFAPGYCWCCRALKHHTSEVVKAAQRLLRR